MIGCCTELHIFEGVSFTEDTIAIILSSSVSVFLEALSICSFFHGQQCTMSSHSNCERVVGE